MKARGRVVLFGLGLLLVGFFEERRRIVRAEVDKALDLGLDEPGD